MNRVLVAMSGGIDSSITAYLLQKEGYEVIGLTFVNYLENPTNKSEIQFVDDARHIANYLGIKHVVIDIRESFRSIIDYFVKEYFHGHTPNPCVLCNPTIKWNVLIEHADLLDAQFIATGHYAIKKTNNNRFYISKGIDKLKDQSYFLYRLPQNYLKRTLFPLGDKRKTEIKEIAYDLGLNRLINKSESFDVCFIRTDDYRDFIKEYSNKNNLTITPGPIIDINGKEVGMHNGIMFYTIGQRRGLGIALGFPAYVVDIDYKNNTIIVGPREALACKKLVIENVSLMKYDKLPPDGLFVNAKIRYRDSGTPGVIRQINDKIVVEFEKPAYGVTPGQSAVFYESEDVVGGGIIV